MYTGQIPNSKALQALKTQLTVLSHHIEKLATTYRPNPTRDCLLKHKSKTLELKQDSGSEKPGANQNYSVYEEPGNS